LAALGLLLSACGGDSAESAVVDFAEIAASEPQFTFDPSATNARLDVETTIRTVCAVAYGETSDLGELATDQNMEAGGHQDHGPVLTGLQPEATYFYRLQGVGPDGTVYQSEILTFSTPAAEVIEAGSGPSITVVDVSSEYSDAFAATNAVDGNPSTEWSTRGDGDDAYIVIDLGAETAVTAVRFVTREMSDGSSVATTYTVTVDDGPMFGPFDAGLDPPLVGVEFTGRILRFDIESSTGGNTGAVEIEVHRG
jgi:hypothetical protein